MKAALTILAALLLLLPGVVFGQAQEKPADPDQAYYHAFYQEKGLRDFADAAKAYGVAADAAKAAGREDLLVRCLVGRARCLVTLGRREEAKAVFKGVLRLDPENAEAKRGVGEGEANAGDDLAVRIFVLVQKLGGPERLMAKKDLLLVGDRAVPALADGLRSAEVGIVEGAAQVLADMGTAVANATLAASFADPEVKYPNALASALDKNASVDARVFVAAFRAADDTAKPKVLESFRQHSARWSSDDPDAVDAFIRTALEARDPAVVAGAVGILGYTSVPDAVASRFDVDFWIRMLESPDAALVDAALGSLNSRKYASIWNEALAATKVGASIRYVRGELSGSPSKFLNLYPVGRGAPIPREPLLDLYAAAGAEGTVLDENSLRNLRSQIFTIFGNATKDSPEERTALFGDGWSRIPDAEGRRYWLDYWTRNGVQGREVAAAAVGDSDPAVREAGYQAFTRPDPEEEAVGAGVFPHLLEDIRSGAGNRAYYALMVADRFHLESALAAVREVLGDPTAKKLRGTAGKALATLAGKDAVPDFRALLATDEWQTGRWQLVELLGVDAVPDLVALAKRLENGFTPVVNRTRNNYYLAIPEPVFQAYFDGLPVELRTSSFLTVEPASLALRPDQLRALVAEALGRDETSWQKAGAGAAGRYHLAEAWPKLLALLDSPEPDVQKAAQQALEEIRTYLDLKASFERYEEGGPAEALQRARELTKSDDPMKRKGGALALGALGDRAGVPDLLTLLDDPDESVRQAALDALTRLGGKQ